MVGLVIVFVCLNLAVGFRIKLRGKVRAHRLKILCRPAVLHTHIKVGSVVKEFGFAEVRVFLFKLVNSVYKRLFRLLSAKIYFAVLAGFAKALAVAQNCYCNNSDENNKRPEKIPAAV